MDGTPIAIVRKLYQLFADGRLDATLSLMDPDVHLIEPGDSAVLPWAGTFDGHEGVRQFYEGLRALSEIAIDPGSLQFFAVGESGVLALGTERGVAADRGREYVTHSAWLWEVRGGLVVRMRAFHDTAAMVEAMRR